MLPVYLLAWTTDIVVMNSIEFWTKENPINKESARAWDGSGDDGDDDGDE